MQGQKLKRKVPKQQGKARFSDFEIKGTCKISFHMRFKSFTETVFIFDICVCKLAYLLISTFLIYFKCFSHFLITKITNFISMHFVYVITYTKCIEIKLVVLVIKAFICSQEFLVIFVFFCGD